MSNAGGAWDNSKKYIEIECQDDSNNPKGTPAYTMKKDGKGGLTGFPMIPKATEHHDACVVGDTVGDPFKDTSGPALNILIKLMSMVSLTIAPLISNNESYDDWALGLVPVGLAIIITIVQTTRHGSILADVDYPDYDENGVEKKSSA